MTTKLNVWLSLISIALLAACDHAPLPPDQEDSSLRAPRNVPQVTSDPLHATYLLDNQPVTLVKGHAERAVVPGSAMKERTDVLGQPMYGDLDGDGDEDAAVLLIHDPGGSGTFVYLAAAVQDAGRYEGSNAIFLGDRIGSPTVTIRHGVIDVHFLDRPDSASFGETPTESRSVRAKLDGLRLRSY